MWNLVAILGESQDQGWVPFSCRPAPRNTMPVGQPLTLPKLPGNTMKHALAATSLIFVLSAFLSQGVTASPQLPGYDPNVPFWMPPHWKQTELHFETDFEGGNEGIYGGLVPAGWAKWNVQASWAWGYTELEVGDAAPGIEASAYVGATGYLYEQWKFYPQWTNCRGEVEAGFEMRYNGGIAELEDDSMIASIIGTHIDHNIGEAYNQQIVGQFARATGSKNHGSITVAIFGGVDVTVPITTVTGDGQFQIEESNPMFSDPASEQNEYHFMLAVTCHTEGRADGYNIWSGVLADAWGRVEAEAETDHWHGRIILCGP